MEAVRAVYEVVSFKIRSCIFQAARPAIARRVRSEAVMFQVGRCPVCKEFVDEAHQNFNYVTVEGKSCRIEMKRPDKADSKAVIVVVHEQHADQFARMVQDGSWSP